VAAYQAAQNEQVGKQTPLSNLTWRENHQAKQPGIEVPVSARFYSFWFTPQVLSNLRFHYMEETLRCPEHRHF